MGQWLILVGIPFFLSSMYPQKILTGTLSRIANSTMAGVITIMQGQKILGKTSPIRDGIRHAGPTRMQMVAISAFTIRIVVERTFI